MTDEKKASLENDFDKTLDQMEFDLSHVIGDEGGDSTLMDSRALKMYHKNMRMHTIKARHLDDVAPPPKPGEHYLIITEKQFNAFALVLSVLENRAIDDLYLAIYRINQPTVAAFIDFIRGDRIKRAAFVISSFFNQTKSPEKWATQLRQFCQNNDRCRHVYNWNHAKVLALKAGEDYYVFEGSGNMSDNARIEQYRYENCRQTYDFHKNWMSDLIDKAEEK